MKTDLDLVKKKTQRYMIFRRVKIKTNVEQQGNFLFFFLISRQITGFSDELNEDCRMKHCKIKKKPTIIEFCKYKWLTCTSKEKKGNCYLQQLTFYDNFRDSVKGIFWRALMQTWYTQVFQEHIYIYGSTCKNCCIGKADQLNAYTLY